MTKKEKALMLWRERYGYTEYARDFHGNLMCYRGYGDRDFSICMNGRRIYCGWNLHHILPKAHGGSNSRDNLICTNIFTNEEAEDKNTFWIDDSLYQVKRITCEGRYGIFKIN